MSKGTTAELEGFNELQELLGMYEHNIDDVVGALEAGAKAFVADAKVLPKPRSQVTKAGYTHLVNSISYRKLSDEVEITWGKYYGPMVENRTRKMRRSHPHMKPLWEKNKKKYQDIEIRKLFG